jgi:hypothetical protein
MSYRDLFTVVGLVSVAAVVLFFSPVYAQQTPGTSTAAASSTMVQTDTVVNPHGSAIQAPVTNVHWRGGFRGGFYGGRRFYGGFYNRPYLYRSWYPYSYRSYYSSYPYFKCWWNGYNWVCPKKRVIIY